MKKLEPPYDLIKCDIEGSEWEFLNNYQNLIKNLNICFWNGIVGMMEEQVFPKSKNLYSLLTSMSFALPNQFLP